MNLCGWLPSVTLSTWLIDVVACISASLPNKILLHSYVTLHLSDGHLMHIWVVLFGNYNEATNNICAQIFVWARFSPQVDTGRKLLGDIINLGLTF